MDKLQELSAPIGRLLLSMIFIFSGFTKITGYAATQGYMESMGVPGMLLPLVIAVELLGGIAILLGFKARLVFAHGPGAYSIDNSHTRRI